MYPRRPRSATMREWSARSTDTRRLPLSPWCTSMLCRVSCTSRSPPPSRRVTAPWPVSTVREFLGAKPPVAVRVGAPAPFVATPEVLGRFAVVVTPFAPVLVVVVAWPLGLLVVGPVCPVPVVECAPVAAPCVAPEPVAEWAAVPDAGLAGAAALGADLVSAALLVEEAWGGRDGLPRTIMRARVPRRTIGRRMMDILIRFSILL